MNQDMLTLRPLDKREELTEFLRSRLIECGWRDQVANMCRNLIQKHGVQHVRLEQIISEVRPKARQSVPESVKEELLEMIRKLDQNQLQTRREETLNESNEGVESSAS